MKTMLAPAAVFSIALSLRASVAFAQVAPSLDVGQAQSDARILSANPDAPVAALEWRNFLRGMVGARIPIVGALRSMGFLLQLPAQIELHNADTMQPVPWEYWRGRLGLEAMYRARVALGARQAALAGAFAIEHESDHASTGEVGLVNLNSMSARGELTVAFGPHALTVSTLARLHVLTCTIDTTYCGRYGGGAGSVTGEFNADVVMDVQLVHGHPYRFFAALHGAWIVENRLAKTERRAALHLGFAVRGVDRGLFQLYALAQAGEDVGWFRARGPQWMAGGGFRWGW